MLMPATLSDFRAMSDRDLISELYRNTQDGSKIRRALSERMHYQGVDHPADLDNLHPRTRPAPSAPLEPTPPEPQRRVLDLTYENFPYMDAEPVLEWMREIHPHQLALDAKQSGFACQNMRDVDKALEWMTYAIAEKSEWRSIPVGAWRFWKAFYQKYKMWKLLKVTA
jgi:hypothetical protein